MEKENIKAFIESKIDDVNDFSELDSLDKVELIMECETKYNIPIEDIEIKSTFTTDDLVEFIYDKIELFKRNSK